MKINSSLTTRFGKKQKGQKPAVKDTFHLTAVIFSSLDHSSNKIPLVGTNVTVYVS